MLSYFVILLKSLTRVISFYELFPLSSLLKHVLNQHKVICCGNRDRWFPFKYNKLNDFDYEVLKNKNQS